MFLVYTKHITNRLQYIFDYVFVEKLGLSYHFTTNQDEFLNDNSSFKISYCENSIGNENFFAAHSLLFETGIKRIDLSESVSDNLRTIFTHNKSAALNFDVFAATFYLLSRYEEYLNEAPVIHGNYNYKNSILYKLNRLHTPIVEQWMEFLRNVLLKNFPSIQFKKQKPRVALSFDIDVAFEYKNRSFTRTIGGFAKKSLQLNFSEAKNQALTLANKRIDMFDTYEYIFSSIKNKKPIFFFDMGLYGKFDKNPSWKNKKFQSLIKNISSKAEIGLHPSYASNKNKFLVTSEKNKLEKISGRQIIASRQHYLKLKFPSTYNNLIENNITEDYTIGYYYNYGFRAGTCDSFLYFDLVKNSTTNLRLYPFAYMDGTLNDVMKLNIEEAKNIIKQLVDTIYNYNGIFIPLWHNSTLCNCHEWKGWREVFEYMLQEIDHKNFENIF